MAGKVTAAKTRFFNQIHYTPETGKLEPIEQEALYRLLTSQLFRRAAALSYNEVRGRTMGLVRANLVTQDGVATALREQGMIAGFSRAYESLFDLLEDLDHEPAAGEE